MKRTISLTLALLLAFSFVFVGVSAYNNDQTDWTCLQKDPYRRGQAYPREQIGAPMQVDWSVDIGGTPCRTLLVGKSMIITAAKEGMVSAFSLATGEKVWGRNLGEEISSDMALSNEIICIPLASGKVVGLDLYSGGTFWEKQESSSVIAPLPYTSQFFVTTEKGDVKAYKALTGESYWQGSVGGEISAPATFVELAANSAFMMSIPTKDNKLAMFRIGSNEVSWEYKTTANIAAPIIPVGESMIYVQEDGKVFCIDARSQLQYWEYDMGSPIKSYPCVFNSSMFLAVATENGKVAVMRLGNGQLIWEEQIDSTISLPLIGIDQNVVICTDDGHLRALNAANGEQVIDIDVGEKIASAPTYSTGSVYLATESGKLMCISRATGSMKFTLKPQIVVISPGDSIEVELELQGDESLSKEQFYLLPREFPCRCKISRDILPNTAIRIGEKRTLVMKADEQAPSSSYEYNIVCSPSRQGLPSLTEFGTVIIAKKSEMIKTSITPEEKDKELTATVSFENAKFLKSFAGFVSYNPELLEPVSATGLLAAMGTFSYDFSVPGKAVLYAATENMGSYDGDGNIFEITFKQIGTGEDELVCTPITRQINGTIVSAETSKANVSVEKAMTKTTVILQIGNPVAKINDTETTLDIAPYITDGRTMVPLRFVGEALGSKVEWLAEERAVIYTNTLATGAREIKLWIGKPVALVDGVEVEMTPAPEIKNSRTCVGLSFVSKNFGVQTGWDGATKTVTLEFEK